MIIAQWQLIKNARRDQNTVRCSSLSVSSRMQFGYSNFLNYCVIWRKTRPPRSPVVRDASLLAAICTIKSTWWHTRRIDLMHQREQEDLSPVTFTAENDRWSCIVLALETSCSQFVFATTFAKLLRVHSILNGLSTIAPKLPDIWMAQDCYFFQRIEDRTKMTNSCRRFQCADICVEILLLLNNYIKILVATGTWPHYVTSLSEHY